MRRRASERCGVPKSPEEGVWDAPLPKAAEARRPRPNGATRGEVAAGLSHGAEEGPGSVAARSADEAVFSFPPASGGSRQPSRTRRQSPPVETEHCCIRRRRRLCSRAAAAPLSAAQPGEKKSRKDAERKRAAEKKSPAVVSARCLELALSLSPPPSALAAPPSSAPRQQQNQGPGWVRGPRLVMTGCSDAGRFPSGSLTDPLW